MQISKITFNRILKGIDSFKSEGIYFIKLKKRELFGYSINFFSKIEIEELSELEEDFELNLPQKEFKDIFLAILDTTQEDEKINLDIYEDSCEIYNSVISKTILKILDIKNTLSIDIDQNYVLDTIKLDQTKSKIIKNFKASKEPVIIYIKNNKISHIKFEKKDVIYKFNYFKSCDLELTSFRFFPFDCEASIIKFVEMNNNYYLLVSSLLKDSVVIKSVELLRKKQNDSMIVQDI